MIRPLHLAVKPATRRYYRAGLEEGLGYGEQQSLILLTPNIALLDNLTNLEFYAVISTAGYKFVILNLCGSSRFPQAMDDQTSTES